MKLIGLREALPDIEGNGMGNSWSVVSNAVSPAGTSSVKRRRGTNGKQLPSIRKEGQAPCV